MNNTRQMNMPLALMIGVMGLIGTPQAANAQSVPSFSVKISGSGPAMLLIPGLASPGSTWDTTVQHFRGGFPFCVVPLAGFAGQPPIGGPFLPRVRDDLISYLRSKRLSHVVV